MRLCSKINRTTILRTGPAHQKNLNSPALESPAFKNETPITNEDLNTCATHHLVETVLILIAYYKSLK